MGFDPDDTIVAIATPPGRGGIGVVRISGPEAMRIAHVLSGRREPLEPRHATFGRVTAARGAADHVILTWFPGPHSYTGDHVVEISAHGSPVLLHAIVEAAVASGARPAEPGEFTFRAYLRGRIDLVQAEAVRDLIEAVTPLQARAAYDQLEGTLTTRIREVDGRLFDLAARLEASLDFPEEGYHFVETGGAAEELTGIAQDLARLLESAAAGRLVRNGVQVAIVGRPNTGKSSLFNSLAGAGRAIVTDLPGTTRDLLTETIDVAGIPMTLIDTAGVHGQAADLVELEGMARAVAVREVSPLLLIVCDRSRSLTNDDRRVLDETAGRPRLIAANKSDLPAAWETPIPDAPMVKVSAKTGLGLEALKAAMVSALIGREPTRDVPAVTNIRHADLIARAKAALERAADAARAGTPEEFVLSDVNEARACLEDVTGARSADDLLHAIFDKFCIGK